MRRGRPASRPAHEQDVAVERGEVDQRAVEGVALGAGGARLLPLLEFLQRAGRAAERRRRRPCPCRRRPARPAATRSRRRRARPTAPRPRPRPRRTRWSAASRQARSEVSDAGIASTSARRPRASASRASRRERPTCPCPAAAAHVGRRRVEAVARRTPATASAGGVRSDDQPAARADRHRHVVGVQRRRAEQEDGARRRLLDRLEQRVGRLLGEPVGVLDDDDLPASERRAAGGAGRRRPASRRP